MKKIKKRNVVLIILVVFVILFSNISFAGLVDQFSGASVSTIPGSEKVTSILKISLKVVRAAGIGIALIVLTVIGIKYMVSSAGDRADIKKNAIPFVIGAIVMLSAAGIVDVIQKFVDLTI